jgi:hypothetical protein
VLSPILQSSLFDSLSSSISHRPLPGCVVRIEKLYSSIQSLGFSWLFHILVWSRHWWVLFFNPISWILLALSHYAIPWLWSQQLRALFFNPFSWILLAFPCTGSFLGYGSCSDDPYSAILYILDSHSSSISCVTPWLWSQQGWALLLNPILDSHPPYPLSLPGCGVSSDELYSSIQSWILIALPYPLSLPGCGVSSEEPCSAIQSWILILHILCLSLVMEAVQWWALFFNPILDSHNSTISFVSPWLWS